ncbi:MAG TPA: LytR C-terminal domain-containing protein [Segeticoccus sp.]|uniref:LytR C-terminal domain-containing protein n=1 Tax=Segeticoccus sp. TaxID=2706531 RepID=UPI002D8009D2|nr:LytR C-terminal domain-containing protein [Segeticoccus sp.]HET8598764.1 LytR C-terminal domain-containing protein [Segeticoccus sp.]
MSYPHESALAAARRRRHRRAVVTLTVVVLMLVGGFGYSLAYYQGWVGDSGRANAAPSTPSASCSPTPSASASAAAAKRRNRGAITPESITVNVYNATKRSGLANAAARELGDHGFRIGSVANDPLNVDVRGVGQIRYGSAGEQQAKLVRHWLKGADLVLDGRTGTSVDLVIGDNYKALTPPPEAQQTATPAC